MHYLQLNPSNLTRGTGRSPSLLFVFLVIRILSSDATTPLRCKITNPSPYPRYLLTVPAVFVLSTETRGRSSKMQLSSGIRTDTIEINMKGDFIFASRTSKQGRAFQKYVIARVPVVFTRIY